MPVYLLQACLHGAVLVDMFLCPVRQTLYRVITVKMLVSLLSLRDVGGLPRSEEPLAGWQPVMITKLSLRAVGGKHAIRFL